MNIISLDEKLNLLEKVADVLNQNKIDYLVYGSMGYQLITGDKDILIRDIDIIVSQTNFQGLVKIYQIGLKGGNQEKFTEYQYKIDQLKNTNKNT